MCWLHAFERAVDLRKSQHKKCIRWRHQKIGRGQDREEDGNILVTRNFSWWLMISQVIIKHWTHRDCFLVQMGASSVSGFSIAVFRCVLRKRKCVGKYYIPMSKASVMLCCIFM
jgi:hypothetical protein